jgi:sugar O-acyltransferase (sialic acid O-acetyltransferase NeuD family)
VAKSGRYILWGSAGHAKVLADIIWLKGGQIVALFDNNPEISSCLPNVPLYHGAAGLQEWLKKYDSLKGIYAVLAIGGTRGKERFEIARQLQCVGFSLPCIIHPSAVVSKTAKLAEGCQILAHTVVAADVLMGRLCIVNNSANIDHECQLGSGVHIAPGAILCGCVSVADNTMIGAGAVVLPRVIIGSDVLVGAGAIVTRDVPDGAVVVGNPAKIIRNSR